jgi:general secretion pathway protein K
MAASLGPSPARPSEQGFVLVAVLWLLAALALLVTVFAVHLSNSARALALNDGALQTEALVSAGVELAAYRLQLSGDDARPSQGAFHVRLNGTDLAVSFLTEAARVDLNAAPKELLSGLLTVLGASEDDASEAADRIVAWRTKPSTDDAAKEDALYRASGRAYSPRQAPFAHVNELGLVLGLTPALVERALPFITVFSGASGIDAAAAAPEVIAALPGMTPLALKQFLGDRATFANNSDAIAAALGGATGGTAKSRAYRVQVQLRFPHGRESLSEVVISLRSTDDPYRVLSWQNDVPTDKRAQAEL